MKNKDANSNEESCCSNSSTVEKKKGGILEGLAYGLMPHIGCIAFIAGSIFGVTFLTEIFRPLLMNQYFFYILVAISLAFATVSSALYLRRNGMLSLSGVRRKWKYLSTMYGSTVGINLLFFLLIFPLLANVSFSAPTGNIITANSLSTLKLEVDIPCSGHATLITEELKTIVGVNDVKFSLPNVFTVSYDTSKATKQQMLSLEVFKTYKATVLDEITNQINSQIDSYETKQTNITNGGCCGSSSCGEGGSCGCGK